MPRGPKGEKRPADVIGNAVRVMRIATGEAQEELSKRPSLVEAGRKGGKARAKAVSSEKRSEIAKAAAKKRWAK